MDKICHLPVGISSNVIESARYAIDKGLSYGRRSKGHQGYFLSGFFFGKAAECSCKMRKARSASNVP